MQNVEPKLAAPGAPLPLSKHILLKFVIGPIAPRITPPAETRRRYERATQRIIEEVQKITPEARSVRILVPPLNGLEDSSRFWSLNGVLEHLLVVSKGLESTILQLSSGTVPNVKVDLAAVKPKNPDQNYFEEFKSIAPRLMEQLDEKLKNPHYNMRSRLTLHHPWFGPFTASQWYWLLGAHQQIHKSQVYEIIKGLKIKL